MLVSEDILVNDYYSFTSDVSTVWAPMGSSSYFRIYIDPPPYKEMAIMDTPAEWTSRYEMPQLKNSSLIAAWESVVLRTIKVVPAVPYNSLMEN